MVRFRSAIPCNLGRALLRATSRLVLPMLVVACASGRPQGTVSPAALARLESSARAQPNRASAARALGVAYYQAERLDEARRTLERAAQLDPRDGATTLYLGLTAERQGDYAAARQAYSQYLRFGRTHRIRRQLEGRLAALARKEMELAAKEAVRNEQALSAVSGSPNTVAVLPMQYLGTDSSLAPLGRGLTELLITDLSRSSQLTVLERARIQTLLSELALAQSGSVDSSTQLRAGRLLQAGRLIQGTIQPLGSELLRVDAAVVDVPTTRAVGNVTEASMLDQLFFLERQLVLELFDALGVQLTVAERNALEQRPTRSLAAFLAFSRGLGAEDDGNFEEASRQYQEAIRIDPGFGLAAQRQQQASQASAAQQVSVTALSAQVSTSPEGRSAEAAARGDAPTTSAAAQETAQSLNESSAASSTGATTTSGQQSTPTKEQAAEGTGGSNPGRPASATIIIRIPLPTP